MDAYNYFPTDPAPGYERYTTARGIETATGTLGPLTGGSIKVELWNVLGTSPATVDLATSFVKVLVRWAHAR